LVRQIVPSQFCYVDIYHLHPHQYSNISPSKEVCDLVFSQ
jgi:hypothetical protein